MSDPILAFVLGATFAGFLAAVAFFVRYYRRTGDRLFAIFAVAFFILGANQIAFLLLGDDVHGGSTPLHAVRVAAYLCILVAIVDKNRR